MPYTLTVEPDLVRVVFSGALTAADLLTMAAELRAIERVRPVPHNRLTDLSQVTDFQLTVSDILAYVDERRGYWRAHPRHEWPKWGSCAPPCSRCATLGLKRSVNRKGPAILGRAFVAGAATLLWRRSPGRRRGSAVWPTLRSRNGSSKHASAARRTAP
jgi:hypothetical protein